LREEDKGNEEGKADKQAREDILLEVDGESLSRI